MGRADLGPPAAYAWLDGRPPLGFIHRYAWEPWHYGLPLAHKSARRALLVGRLDSGLEGSCVSYEAQARNSGRGAERRAARGALRSYSEEPEEL